MFQMLNPLKDLSAAGFGTKDLIFSFAQILPFSGVVFRKRLA